VEVDEALDDHAPGAGATAALGVVPGRLDLARRAHRALALARTRHHRLDHARQADLADRAQVLLARVDEAVRRGREAQGLGRKPADAFAVHREARRARGR